MAAYNGKATTRENPGCVHCHTQAAVVGCGNLTRAMMCSFRRSLRAIGLWIIEWHPISFFSDHTFPFGRLTDVEREGGKCYAVWTWASLSRPQKLAPDVFHVRAWCAVLGANVTDGAGGLREMSSFHTTILS